jgi:hypothetical protein
MKISIWKLFVRFWIGIITLSSAISLYEIMKGGIPKECALQCFLAFLAISVGVFIFILPDFEVDLEE